MEFWGCSLEINHTLLEVYVSSVWAALWNLPVQEVKIELFVPMIHSKQENSVLHQTATEFSLKILETYTRLRRMDFLISSLLEGARLNQQIQPSYFFGLPGTCQGFVRAIQDLPSGQVPSILQIFVDEFQSLESSRNFFFFFLK